MPATLTAIDGGRGFRLVGTGVLTGPDIINIKTGLEADPDFDPGFTHWLVDLTAVTELQMSSPEVRAIVEVDRRLARLMPDAVVAVVAPADAAFGLARMWEILAEGIGWPTGVFRTVAEAEAWIRSQTADQPEKVA
jgi:hypothetical protein